MSGTVVATLTCGVADCEQSLTSDVVSDGWYPYFHVPLDWHVVLGTKFRPEDRGDDTLVRCPEHCALVDGQWQDHE